MEITTIEELQNIITENNADEIATEMTLWIIGQSRLKKLIRLEKEIEEAKEKKTFTYNTTEENKEK